MTAQPLAAPPPASIPVNWTMLAFFLAVLVQFGVVVSYGARAQAQINELKSTTQPLRDGQLVEIRTNVAWIRAELERERERGRAQ